MVEVQTRTLQITVSARVCARQIAFDGRDLDAVVEGARNGEGVRNANALRWTEVDLGGFEPPTSSMRTRRAPNCATGPWCSECTQRALAGSASPWQARWGLAL